MSAAATVAGRLGAGGAASIPAPLTVRDARPRGFGLHEGGPKYR
jgi:hypothetical protein